MRRRLLFCLALAAALTACGVTKQKQPVGSSVEIQVINSLELSFARPVRLALIYTLGDGSDPYWVAWDESIPTLNGEILLPLEVPPEEVLAVAAPIETMRVREGFAVEIYRPRIVLYEDVSGSGTFEPSMRYEDGEDRVIAIESTATPSVALVYDLDGMLETMRLEEAESYYFATGNRFTPFVRTVDEGGLRIAYEAGTSPVFLAVTDSPVPQERLACLRERVWLFGGLGPTTRVTAHVGVGVEADTVCGVAIPDCAQEDLASLPVPTLESPVSDAVLRVVQCRAIGDLEVLILHEATRTCEECVCVRRGSAEVYFSEVSAAPDWWPCGDTIDYCESPLPLYQIDTDCIVEEEEEEEEEEED